MRFSVHLCHRKFLNKHLHFPIHDLHVFVHPPLVSKSYAPCFCHVRTFPVSLQDLNPRPCAVNDHPSVLAHEMMTIEPGEKPTRMLTWKTTAFLSHIQSRSHDDHFPIPLWETWFCQSLGVPVPALFENDNVLVVNLVLTITVITFRRVNVYLQHLQRTSGSYIDSVCYYTRLVTELRPIE
jgi:hypothetical protein